MKDGKAVVGEVVGNGEGIRLGAEEGAPDGTGVGNEYFVGDADGGKVVGTRVGEAVDGANVGSEVGGDAIVG